MTATILIIEDEQDLVNTVEYALQREGYQTRAALTGEDGLALARTAPAPDLVLLDLMLPDIAGNEVCRRLRSDPATRHVPVVMVTAKDEEIDRVVGFEVGADDYVVKPFSVRELMLRIRAVLRRSRGVVVEGECLELAGLRVERDAHRVWVDGQEVTLTALEFRLLVTLMERRGRVQTRDVLLSDVWGIDADVTTRTVDTHIKRLRHKLGGAGANVETIRGVGYRFRAEADEAGA